MKLTIPSLISESDAGHHKRIVKKKHNTKQSNKIALAQVEVNLNLYGPW